MGKRARRKQRAFGVRKEPNESKLHFAKRVIARLEQMDREALNVIQGS